MSIIRRFVGTYIFNLIGLFFTFLSGVLLANYLGPEVYGIFSFLIAIFSGLFYFLDFGSSSAFFTFHSQQERAPSFFLNYFIFLASVFFLVLLVILFSSDNFLGQVFLSSDRSLLIIAILGVFLRNHLWNILRRLFDAQRLSAQISMVNALVSMVYFCLIFILNYFGYLSIKSIFKLISIEYILFSIIIFYIYPLKISTIKKDRVPFKKYIDFCLPIAPMIAFLGAIKLIEPWFLSTFGGFQQQAFLGISVQASSILVLSISSIINIYWKELAVLIEKNDYLNAQNLYQKTLKYMYFGVLSLSLCLFLQADNLIELLFGEEYIAATSVLMLYFLYPAIQLIGQINGTTLLAAEKTTLYSKYQFIFGFLSLMSLIIIFILKDYYAIADSLAFVFALKILLVSMIYVGVTGIGARKAIKFNGRIYFIVLFPLLIFAISFLAKFVTDKILIFFNYDFIVLSLIIHLLIQVSMSIFLIAYIPKVFLINKYDLDEISSTIKNILGKQ